MMATNFQCPDDGDGDDDDDDGDDIVDAVAADGVVVAVTCSVSV
jgi:hypothetical protein